MRHDHAVGVALVRPAIIQADILVPGTPQAVGSHGIGNTPDESLVDIGVVKVPTVVAHGRG